MLKTVFAFLVVFVVVGFALFTGCSKVLDDMCGNEILRVVPSPDGAFKAVIFSRDCGATTGYSEQVSLLAASANLPNDAGNTFVADGDHGAAPKGPQVEVSWKDKGTIVIKHHPKAQIFRAEKQVEVGGISANNWLGYVRTVKVIYP